jgi:hypothetical protein
MGIRRFGARTLAACGVLACLSPCFAQRFKRPQISWAHLPAYFVENGGRFPDEVAFSMSAREKTFFFLPQRIVVALRDERARHALEITFVRARSSRAPEAMGEAEARISHFKGKPSEWRTDLGAFRALRYRDLWPGIDLVLRATGNALKYEFALDPGADPAQVRLRIRGAAGVVRTPSGGIRLRTPAGDLVDGAPIAYQPGAARPVAVDFVTEVACDENAVDILFDVGDFDPTRPLVVDPAVLVYAGFLGGGQDEEIRGVAVDHHGNAYVAGWTRSPQVSFPVKVGPDLTFNDTSTYAEGDAFVAKVSADGRRLIYCGYVGGASTDGANAIAVDVAGCAYIVGETTSDETTFPVKVGPGLKAGDNDDVFVAKVSASGDDLVYCGFVAGSRTDRGEDIEIDGLGRACIAGWTSSTESTFPVKVGPQLKSSGLGDAFVARVNQDGSGLDFCGFLGGSEQDAGYGVAADNAGGVYIAGQTASQDFPTVVGPALTFGGSRDAFVAKVEEDGKRLAYSGFIGGFYSESALAVGVDGRGQAVVAGWTQSSEVTFPVTQGPELHYDGASDGFVSKVQADGRGLVYSGFLGGEKPDLIRAVAVRGTGEAYVVGKTASPESSFPVRGGPDLTYNGPPYYSQEIGDAFVAAVSADGRDITFAGYIGGSADDEALGVAVDASGNAYVGGWTRSTEASFPVCLGPDLVFNGGTTDAFLAKVAHATLRAKGNPWPDRMVTLLLSSSDSPDRPYQLGTALGQGPIPIDTRKIDLQFDALLYCSVNNLCVDVFQQFTGILDAVGQGQASLRIPGDQRLVGVTVHTAFVTLDPAAPSGIRSISNTIPVTIVGRPDQVESRGGVPNPDER